MDPFFKRVGAGAIPGFIMTTFLVGFIGLIQILSAGHYFAAFALIWIAWSYKFGKSAAKGDDETDGKITKRTYSR